MKNTAIALLLLGCGAAHAQSNVTVYGVADAGLVLERGAPAGNTSNVSSGIASGSRFGFKGTEDLGGGLKASFVLEGGVSLDTGASGQGGLTFGRQSYVALSGNMGTISMGRQYSPYFKGLRDIADPFTDGTAGQAANIMVNNRRMDNAVTYATPKWAGWSAEASYGAGEVAGDSTRRRALSGALSYAQGPLAVVLAHHRREDAAVGAHARNSMLAARYDLGAYQLRGAYVANQAIGTALAAGAASRDVLLGLCATFGPHRVAASVIQHLDRTPADRDARQLGVAYYYGLSKRTDLYTAYGHIDNDNGASFKVGNATDDGKGNAAFNLGIRHIF